MAHLTRAVEQGIPCMACVLRLAATWFLTCGPPHPVCCVQNERNPKRKRRKLHDLSDVSSVGIIARGSLDEYRFNMFMRDLLTEKAKDIFRCKGVLSIHVSYGDGAQAGCWMRGRLGGGSGRGVWHQGWPAPLFPSKAQITAVCQAPKLGGMQIRHGVGAICFACM